MVGVVSYNVFYLFCVLFFDSLTIFSRLPRQVLLQSVLEAVHQMLVVRAQELVQEVQ
jgi:hypothetical protein